MLGGVPDVPRSVPGSLRLVQGLARSVYILVTSLH